MTWPKSIVVLCGGVGAAKFLTGLAEIFPGNRITAIVNTGDDIILHGLYISPDIDIIVYSLAGIADEKKGWGISGDTFFCLSALKKLGQESWFNIGDRDLATHVVRTRMMSEGYTLSQITRTLSKAFKVIVSVIPMTDQHVETIIATRIGDLHFQDYLVKRGMRDRIISIKFKGIHQARPAPGVLRVISRSDLLIIAPSNPFVSIGTIVSIKGVREAMRKRTKPSIAISPIIAGKAIKGPLALMFRDLGMKPSAFEVAKMYSDITDAFVLDRADIELEPEIRKLGLVVFSTDTLMIDKADRMRIAREVLRFSTQLARV